MRNLSATRVGCVADWRAVPNATDPERQADTVPPNSRSDLYLEELQDLYRADNPTLKALANMNKAATSPEL